MAAGPLRFGLIGAGRWGMNILRTVTALDGVVLHRLATRRADVAVPEGCIVTRDWRDLLNAADLDGIALALPPEVQVDIAAQLLSAGIPLFLEKPMARDYASATRLHDLALARGLPVVIDHIYLFHPAYRAMRATIRSSGAISSIDSMGGNKGPFRREIPPLWDWGPHDVAMCLDLTGESPSAITAQRQRTERRPEGDCEIVRTDFTYPSGARSHSVYGNAMPEKVRRLTVVAGDARIVFDDLATDKLVHYESGRAIVIGHAKTNPLAAALASFRDGVTAGRVDEAGLGLAVEVVRVLALVEEALQA